MTPIANTHDAVNDRPGVAAAGHAIEVERLSVRFGDAVVLDKISFVVPRKTSLAVIGPNGAGKTVLFKALIGALPHEGTIRWAQGTRTGYVPQKLDLERDLPVTGQDFLHAKAVVTGSSPAEVVRATNDVGFSEALLRRPIGALSGGQFQRLMVAVALVGKPSILLLDEPTAGVDLPGQETMNETLERLRVEQGLTVLVISHDLSVVYRYASNVLCLGRGKACFGPPKTILTPAMLEGLYGAPVSYHIHDGPRS
jgi:zinc transport system ATP-binding protein